MKMKLRELCRKYAISDSVSERETLAKTILENCREYLNLRFRLWNKWGYATDELFFDTTDYSDTSGSLSIREVYFDKLSIEWEDYRGDYQEFFSIKFEDYEKFCEEQYEKDAKKWKINSLKRKIENLKKSLEDAKQELEDLIEK